MDKHTLTRLLNNPQAVQTVEQGDLEKLIAAYPWFSTSHLLLTKKHQLAGANELEQKIAYASAFANDRQALYQLLYEVPAPSLDTAAIEEISLQSVAENVAQLEPEPAEEEQTVERDAEIEAVQTIESELVEENRLMMSGEFQAMSASGSAAEISLVQVGEEKEEDWVEEKTEPEIEAIQELEQQFISHDLNERVKESALMSASTAEHNHKNEEQEPDDERYFEERFDTELESIKTIDQQTSVVESEKEEEEWVEPVNEDVIENKKETVAESYQPTQPVQLAGERHTFNQWLNQFKVAPGTASPPPADKPIIPAATAPEPLPAKETVMKTEENDLLVGEFTPDYLSAEAAEDLKTIDRFVESLKEKREADKQEKEVSIQNLALNSLLESDELLTETLAKIYEKQGKTQKAIQTYEKLSLKFPEKSAYFATLIKGLKNKL